MYISDLRRFRTYKGNSVRDLLRAMRNKVSLQFLHDMHPDFFFKDLDTVSLFLTFSLVTETSLPRVASRGAGDSRRAARRLCQLLHLTVPTVTDAHTCCSAHLRPRETVSPLLSAPQHQITHSSYIYVHIR